MGSVFETLNNVNVNGHTEQKNGLTYLSWAWAWAEAKKYYPGATYKVYENKDEWNYFTDGKTCWVKTGVTIEGIEYIEYLPVMDFKNRSIPADNVTSFDVNKAIQRSLTKALARHGLGLYIYAGEDLPEDEKKASDKPASMDKVTVSEQEQKMLYTELQRTGVSLKSLLANYGVKSIEGMTIAEFTDAMKKLKARPAKAEKE